MDARRLRLMLWYGLLASSPKGVELCKLSAALRCRPFLIVFRVVSGLESVRMLLMVLMLLPGLFLSVCWSRLLPFLTHFTGMHGLSIDIFGQGVQFQCRLFLLVQALTFGVRVAF